MTHIKNLENLKYYVTCTIFDWYPALFLLSRKFLSNIVCLSISMKLGPESVHNRLCKSEYSNIESCLSAWFWFVHNLIKVMYVKPQGPQQHEWDLHGLFTGHCFFIQSLYTHFKCTNMFLNLNIDFLEELQVACGCILNSNPGQVCSRSIFWLAADINWYSCKNN